MQKKTGRIAATALVLPVVLAFAACGTTTTPGTSTSGSSSATTKAVSHLTTPAELTAALTKASEGLGTLHMSMKADEVSIEGDLDKSAGKKNMHLTMGMTSGTIDIIVLDGTGYLKGFPGVPEGKWVSAKATDQQMADLTKSFDLSTIFSQFAKDVTGVKYVASEQIDGVQTDKYELTITKNGKSEKGSIWLDDKNQVRKAEGVDEDGKTQAVTFTKVGEPVTITAPPAAEVTEMPKM